MSQEWTPLFSAIILAGGLGTRIRDLFPELPKPLIPCQDKAFIEWIILYLKNQGVQTFTISSGYKAEKIETYFKKWSTHVQVCSETRPLGTGGGLLYAFNQSRFHSEYTIVCNGDSLLLINLKQILLEVAQKKPDFVIVGTPVSDVSRFGSLAISTENTLIGFNEKGRSGHGIINSGIYIIKSELLEKWPDIETWKPPVLNSSLSIETNMIPALLKSQKKICVEVGAGAFIDIGTPSSVREADSFIRDHKEYFQI